MLRDGTRATIRPICADDKARLQDGLRQLSARSRYLRFHAPIDHFTQEQLRYLTEIDYRDHMAWVALDPDEPDAPGMGVARYVRLRGEPQVAEAAVTVLDRYQGRGLGTVLLQALRESAADNRIRTLRNYVLAENTAMLEVFDALGAERVAEGGGVYRIDVHLADERERHTARQVLRSAARGLLPPFEWAFPSNATLRHPEAWLPRRRDTSD